MTRYERATDPRPGSSRLYTEKTHLVITDQGRAYYAEMRAYYRQLYPQIVAPHRAEPFAHPSTDAERLAARIRQKRGSRGFREAAQLINHPLVSPAALSRAEQGKPIADSLKAVLLSWLDSDQQG